MTLGMRRIQEQKDNGINGQLSGKLPLSCKFSTVSLWHMPYGLISLFVDISDISAKLISL